MDKESLHELVAKLHAELADALAADPKSRQSLGEMMQDINRLIDKPADAATWPSGSPTGSLPERLEAVAVRFEAAHPTLAAGARRLVDLLGEVGI
jgi:Domain of unknown function (DUF4404)